MRITYVAHNSNDCNSVSEAVTVLLWVRYMNQHHGLRW